MPPYPEGGAVGIGGPARPGATPGAMHGAGHEGAPDPSDMYVKTRREGGKEEGRRRRHIWDICISNVLGGSSNAHRPIESHEQNS